MIAKIGFVILVLFSCGTLFLLDYYLKQDQEENSKQLHYFVQQTRDVAKAKSTAKEKFEMQIMTDLAHCQDNAQQTYNKYISLIQRVAPNKNGKPAIPMDIQYEATSLQAYTKAECTRTYDTRMNEGI